MADDLVDISKAASPSEPIKLVCVINPKQVSLEEHTKRWSERHAPLVKSLATKTGQKKYVQNPVVESPMVQHIQKANSWPPSNFYGITEVWFENLDEMMRVSATPANKEAQDTLKADEQEAQSSVIAFLSYERVVFDHLKKGDKSVKLIALIKRKPGLSWQEWSDAWAKLSSEVERVGPSMGFRKYVQTRAYKSSAMEAMQAHRGWPKNEFDGMAQIWFDSEEAAMKAGATKEGQEAGQKLATEEANFIGEVAMFMSYDRIVFDYLA